jgi:hypothetical protein
MLFILDTIISLTQMTGRGGPGVPCCGLKAKGVDTQSETGNTANDISSGRSRKIDSEGQGCRENEEPEPFLGAVHTICCT